MLASTPAQPFDDETIRQRGEQLIRNNLHRSEIHPDAWEPAIIRDPADTEARLAEVAGAKYSYRDLDDYTELIQRTLQGVPETSKVSRSGVLPNRFTSTTRSSAWRNTATIHQS